VVTVVAVVGAGVSRVLVVLVLLLTLTLIVPTGCRHSVHYQYVPMMVMISTTVVSCATKRSTDVFDGDDDDACDKQTAATVMTMMKTAMQMIAEVPLLTSIC